jgi:deoxyribodipyrimidine photo-lyase
LENLDAGSFAKQFRDESLRSLAAELNPWPLHQSTLAPTSAPLNSAAYARPAVMGHRYSAGPDSASDEATNFKAFFKRLQLLGKFDLIIYTSETCIWETRHESVIREIFPKIMAFDQTTMIAESDLNFQLDSLPSVFTAFRQKVESQVLGPIWFETRIDQIWGPRPGENLDPFRPQAKCVDVEKLNQEAGITLTQVTPLAFSESSAPIIEFERGYQFRGGSRTGHQRIKHYFWETNKVQTYFESRNGMIEIDDSTKISPWLATGSLSARELLFELRLYERERCQNKSTYWILFELLWRDFFKFEAKRLGARLFQLRGVLEEIPDFDSSPNGHLAFKAWQEGRTKYPLINACMNELRTTGWLSNRGRQNVASYLAKEVCVPWTWGARWFEQHLVDYDPAQNWGNWSYFAGVGRDPRNRRFNIETQTKTYDPEGAYQDRWKT